MQVLNRKAHWERMLTERFDLAGSGYESLGVKYNEWLYRARVRAIRDALARYGITVDAKTAVLEIGCGTGFWVGLFAGMGVKDLTGIDITDISIQALSQRFPQFRFLQDDISSRAFNLRRRYDLITALDMLWYLDHEEFPRAVANLARACAPGGYIFMSDILSEGPIPQHVGFWARGMADYQSVCEKNGLMILGVCPMFFFMNTPADYHAFRGPRTRKAHEGGWRLLKGCLERFPALGGLLGAALYWIDGIAGRVCTRSPSTKLLICQLERGAE